MTANTNPSPNSFTFYMGFLSINNWNAANIAVNGKMPFSVSQKGIGFPKISLTSLLIFNIIISLLYYIIPIYCRDFLFIFSCCRLNQPPIPILYRFSILIQPKSIKPHFLLDLLKNKISFLI